MAKYCFLVTLILVIGVIPLALGDHDYGEALNKGILFYEAQRSGFLPSNQRVEWRSNSGLNDGRENGVNLVGGYYDAGDNVKFGLPMAFTITMLSWSIIEYGRQMANTGELNHAMDAVKWGTDYFIKAHPQPNVLYGEVGDGNTDHYCWQRPEDMTTSRTAYRIDTTRPGSDLAGETAAAMAAASIVFRHSDPAYSAQLLNHAGQLFEFADKYRGKYDGSITVAQKYYRSVSGYADELLWAAAWMYKATNKDYYMNYLGENGNSLGGTDWAMTEFSWDVKYPGVQTLVAKMLLQGKGGQYKTVFEQYQQKAEYFMCACLGKSSQNVQRTPGGLLYLQSWNNMQFVTTSSFLLTVYSDYLSSTGKSLNCPSGNVAPSELLSFAKSQVDYILGDNPRATSYMVGYGNNYPQQVHHRASSIVSYKVDPSFVTCQGGYATWFGRRASDPNVLTGALVGGPGPYDNFADERDNYEQTEPATYNNAPLVGVLARLHGGQNAYNQILAEDVPIINPNPTAQPKLVQKPVVTSPVAGTDSSPIDVEQKMTTSWVANGKTYYRYLVILINKSDKTLNKLNLSIQNLYGPIWGVTKIGESYSFPPWINSLAAGKSMEFVYIHSAPPAGLSIASYTLN